MHGLVNRQGYANKGFVLDEGQLGTDIEAMTAAMNKYAPIPKSRFPMGQIGLNLISGEFAGDGFLQNLAGSARDPYSQWTGADDARRMAQATRKGSAVTTAVGQQYAQELARRKAAGTSTMQKDYTTERKKFMLFQEYTKDPKDKFGKTVYKVHPEIMANYGSYIQDEAMKTEEGRKFLRQTDGIVPHTVKRDKGRDVVVVSYDKLLAGGVYFDPTYNAFVQRVPRSDEDGEVIPEHIILIDPYTFEEVRKINLK
jgi:hypothetical protein